MRRNDSPEELGRRLTGLRVTALQPDPSWYERRWLEEPAPRRPAILSRLGAMAAAALRRAAAVPAPAVPWRGLPLRRGRWPWGRPVAAPFRR